MIPHEEDGKTTNENETTPQRAVICDQCNNRFIFDATTGSSPFLHQRPVAARTGTIEVGLVCPGCGAWYHVSYTNKILELQRREAELTYHPTRRSSLRGRYSRRFTRFQQEIEKKLANRP